MGSGSSGRPTELSYFCLYMKIFTPMTTVLSNVADDEDNDDEGDFRAFKFLIITQSVACI